MNLPNSGFPTMLREFSNLYPDMRLGQIVSMILALSDADAAWETGEVADSALIDAGNSHLERRAAQLGMDRQMLNRQPIPTERATLLELVARQESDRAGATTTILRAARASSAGLYDVEDEELIGLFTAEVKSIA